MAKKAAANPALNAHTLVLDGKKYELVYNFRAMATFEELTGVNLLHGLDPNLLTSKQLGLLLWAGLLKQHPDIEVDALFDLLTPSNVVPVFTAIMQAYTNSKPEPEPESDSRPQEPVSEKS